MKVLVVDNEPNIRKGIATMVKDFCPEVAHVFEAEGVVTGLEKILEVSPDVLLLDVELDDGTGMDLLASLGDINLQVIFVTAFNKYAIDAFKFSAIDFLLKPISPEDLMESFKKIKKQESNKELVMQLSVLKDCLQKITLKEKKIVLKDINSIYFVNIEDIVRCESDGQYTEFYINNHSKIVISKSLKEYEELLQPFGFIRPHHSHLINIAKISRFDKINGGSLIMQNQDEIPVSHRKKTQILKLLDSL